MAFLTNADIQAAYQRNQGKSPLQKTASVILKEAAAKFKATDTYDVFLSHCLKDADKILGVKAYIEEQGFSVYVDWIEDPQLDRGNVTPATADQLRARMSACASMVFATSENSPNSKWMPWELGYFDGLRKGRIAVLPLVAREGENFEGQQYIGLYPKIEKLQVNQTLRPFVTKGKTYMTLDDFKIGKTQFKPFQ